MLADAYAPALPGVPPAEAALRLSLAASQMLGIAIARYVVRAPALVDMELPAVVAMVAPAIQHYLTRPLPGTP